MRLFVGFLAVLSAAAPGSADDTGWRRRLEEVVARAIVQNPSIAEMEARIEAARHRVGQSTAFPDPEIEVALQDIPTSDFSFSRDDFTMEKVSTRQRIPGAGKRPSLERSAQAELASIAAMHADHVIRVAAETADAFFAIADLDTRIRILEESHERLRRVATSATERYRVGKGVQADVLRANLEVTGVEERLVGLRGERRMTTSRLNTLQALPPGAGVDPILIPDPEPSAPLLEDLVHDAEARSPAVAAAAAGVRMAEEQLTLARLERRPDFTAMAYYAHRVDFDDLVGASVAFNLPFFQPKRLKEREAEREAELSVARANLEMLKNEIRRGVSEAHADLERSIEQARLYRDSILPQAETNVRAAQEAYAVGQIDFLTFVRAALDRDAYEGELAMRRAGAWRALAALQRASGIPLIAGTAESEHDHAKE